MVPDLGDLRYISWKSKLETYFFDTGLQFLIFHQVCDVLVSESFESRSDNEPQEQVVEPMHGDE